jgi:hypothetical protein
LITSTDYLDVSDTVLTGPNDVATAALTGSKVDVTRDVAAIREERRMNAFGDLTRGGGTAFGTRKLALRFTKAAARLIVDVVGFVGLIVE